MIKTFKESIIDIPRKTYSQGVFDKADTPNPKLKKVVLDMINNQLKKFNDEAPVIKHSLIGSILTKRYRDDADLDVNVLFGVPKAQRDEVRLKIAKSLKGINGKLIPGTKHPINYYVITDPELKAKNDKMADGVFDIKSNSWVRKPTGDEFDKDQYEKEFQRKVQEIDVVTGELQRDLIDYQELTGLQPTDIADLQELINKKLEEIEEGIKVLVKIGDDTMADRHAAFSNDMSPDEIRKFGKKHKLPKNVIYKYLEKYHYQKLYKKLKEILEDGKVTDDEIKSLAVKEQLDELSMRDFKRWTTDRGRIKAALALWKKMKYKVDQQQIAQWAGIDYREFDDAVRAAGLKEELLTEKHMAFTFGRFNPPTTGHEKLIKKVNSVRADTHKIYISRSEDSKKNPLSARDKLDFMQKMFPRYGRDIEINTTNMILDIVVKLYRQNYTDITMVVGSDRVREFDTILKKYNDVQSRHGYYNFKNINIVSAGERDPDAEGAMGMSASKMRSAAAQNDFATFKRGLPSGFGSGERLFKAVRQGMNLAASMGGMIHVTGKKGVKPMANLRSQFEAKQVRDLYIREQLFNINDTVKSITENLQGVVKRRGTNYVLIEDDKENLHKCWIWDCMPINADKEAIIREYNLDIDYGFKAVSDKEEEIKMNEDNKSLNQFKKDLVGSEEQDEAYEIGADYANHTKEITPGETPSEKPVDTKARADRAPEANKKVTKEDIDDWSASESTIDKYKKRYGEEWKVKLEDATMRMHEDLAEDDERFKSFKEFAK